MPSRQQTAFPVALPQQKPGETQQASLEPGRQETLLESSPPLVAEDSPSAATEKEWQGEPVPAPLETVQTAIPQAALQPAQGPTAAALVVQREAPTQAHTAAPEVQKAEPTSVQGPQTTQ